MQLLVEPMQYVVGLLHECHDSRYTKQCMNVLETLNVVVTHTGSRRSHDS